MSSRWIRAGSTSLAAGLVLGTVASVGVAAKPAVSEKQIAALLKSHDPVAREKGLQLLGQSHGVSVVPRVNAFLADADLGVRLSAVTVLADMHTELSRDALLAAAISCECSRIRKSAAIAIRMHFPKEGAKKLVGELQTIDSEKKLHVIEALDIVGGQAAVDALGLQAVPPGRKGRASMTACARAAIEGLGQLHAGERILLRALEIPSLRMEAAVALARLDTDAARGAILGLLSGKKGSHMPSFALRRIAWNCRDTNLTAFESGLSMALLKPEDAVPLLEVALYGRIGKCAPVAHRYFLAKDPRARSLAYRVASIGGIPLNLEDVSAGMSDPDPRVRRAAAAALLHARGQDSDSIETVLSQNDGDIVLIGVSAALKNAALLRRDTGPLTLLRDVALGKRHLKDGWLARSASCVALGWIEGAASVDALSGLTRSPKWWLRAAALEGLSWTYDKRSIPLLIAALADGNAIARRTAREALECLTKKDFAKRSEYVRWWSRVHEGFELIPPRIRAGRAKKYGYAVDNPTPYGTPTKILDGGHILVVKGSFDTMGRILDELHVRYTALQGGDLDKVGLSPRNVLLINCGATFARKSYLDYLRWYVATGGRLIGDDFALSCIEESFSGYVSHQAGKGATSEWIGFHDIEGGEPRSDTTGDGPKFFLAGDSFLLNVDDPATVHIPADSAELCYLHQRSAVMAEFQFGLGTVLYSVGHFYISGGVLGNWPDRTPNERRMLALNYCALTIGDMRELNRKKVFDDRSDPVLLSTKTVQFKIFLHLIKEKEELAARR